MPGFDTAERRALVIECGKVAGQILALTTILALEDLSGTQVMAEADKVRDAASDLFDKMGDQFSD